MSEMSEFHPFPRLPAELRLKIFTHALPLFSRIIEVKALCKPISETALYSDLRLKPTPFAMRPTCTLTLLQINSETRAEMLKHYSSPFHAAISPNIQHLLFDWEHDIIYLNLPHGSLRVYLDTPSGPQDRVLLTPLALLSPRVPLFSPKRYEEMRKRLCRVAGNWSFWMKGFEDTWDNKTQCPLQSFDGLKELIIIHRSPRIVGFEEYVSRWTSASNYLEIYLAEEMPNLFVRGVTV